MTYYIYCKGKKATAKTLRGARGKSYDMFFSDGLRGGRIAMIYNENRYVGATMEYYSIGHNNHYDEHLVWYSNGKVHSMDSSGDIYGVIKKDTEWAVERIKEHRAQFLKERRM